jgi:hypothetical protein
VKEPTTKQLADHLARKTMLRLEEATNKRVRNYMGRYNAATDENYKQRYFKRAAAAAARSAYWTERIKEAGAKPSD